MSHAEGVGIDGDSLPRCPDGTLVGEWGGSRKVVPARCRRWACPECGPKKGRKLARRIVLSEATRFLTLTLRVDPDLTAQEQLDELNRGWRALWKRIKREFGTRARGYVRVVELTKKGTPHLHLALQCPYIHQSVLSRWWQELTGSSVVDIRKIRSEKGLARYLAKYLTKAHERVVARRKWSATQGFLPADEPAEKSAFEEQVRWSWVPTDALRFLDAHVRSGWREVAEGILVPPQVEPWPG